ncbi:MAG: methylmalonyl Co-A mutase-associated GTPase MeaB [Gammaproteobacteria bacterium]|nr:methylmalonyl Co-A mutase-associated GTPase MeaB [Gammaproteobacteria bacterium]
MLKQSQVTELLSGDRRALAKAITLIESARADDQIAARTLLDQILPHSGQAIRVGISGVPGVGKSTFIEALGLSLTEQGHKLAVLAVDPSSRRTGGSIMGDKTRMELLSRDERAFIRPSPASGALGGVASRTRETMLLCEAAGYDVIIVETVGVGQSEVTVAGMVDFFLLLQLPNAGDELQAIKRGIMELADAIVINKADIDPQATELAKAQFTNALHLMKPASPDWIVPVLPVSALNNQGVEAVWSAIETHHRTMLENGELAQKRAHQAVAWMESLIDEALLKAFRDHPEVGRASGAIIDSVASGRLSAVSAAAQLLATYGLNSS